MNILLEAFQNTYSEPLELGLVNLDFQFRDWTFKGPWRVTDRRHKHLHKIEPPFDNNKVYWIPISSKCFYRGYNGYRLSLYSSEDLSLEDYKEAYKEFTWASQFQYVTYLCMKLASIGFREIRGDFLNHTLKPFETPESNLILHLTKFPSETINQDNVLNLSLF